MLRAIARMLGTTEKAGLFDATIQQQFNPATARMGALQREERDALGTKAVHMYSAEQGRYHPIVSIDINVDFDPTSPFRLLPVQE